MRLLCIGYPMPNPKIDNHTILSAPSLFDYDAVIVDPSSISSAVEGVLNQTGEARSFGGQPVADGPSSPVHVGLAEALRARIAETERLLARGGLVIVHGYPNVLHPVSGFAGCDRYFWLPAPAGLVWGPPDLVMGASRHVVLTEQNHPFGAYIDDLRTKIEYRAYFAERARFGEGARVFARSEGGAAVGVEFALGPGRIVFVPPAPRVAAGPERGVIAARMLDAAARMLGAATGDPAPTWVRAQPLPGLEQREAALAEAEEKAAGAQSRLDEERRALGEIAKYQRLLWQEGRYALDPVVHDAMRLLGFEVRGVPGEPVLLVSGRTELMIEIEGSDEAVGMAAHYRLRERRERHLAERGQLPPGLLIVNGHRMKAPDARPAQYSEPLRIASESMGYGILTTAALFRAVQRALAEPDAAWMAAARQKLASEHGPIADDLAGAATLTEDTPSRPAAH